MIIKKSLKNIALISLLQLKNVIADQFSYSVVALPTEYGGTQVGVIVDGGQPVVLTPSYNGFLWKGAAERPTNNYYYAILDATGKVINSEANYAVNATLAGNEQLNFQRDPPADKEATTTLNETYGVKYTVGDSLIKGIPRVYPKTKAYDKFSLLYQEGQVPNIRAECSERDYNTLVTSLESDVEFYNCTMTFITPYKDILFTDITLSIAGQGSRGFKKRPFRIDITEGSVPNKLFSRDKFKLRNLAYDCTYIKNKLAVDIETSLGMASGQSGFARFYVNNQPFGLYDLFDPLKKKFVKQNFHPGEKDVKTGPIFKGNTADGTRYYMEVVDNLSSIYNIDVVPEGADPATFTGEKDLSELLNFIYNELDTASVDRVKEVLDLDQLLKTIMVEYLIDHRDGFLIGGNNFDIYRNYDTGRYHIWSFDFDATFGKFQTYPTNTPFEKYILIPESYSKRPATAKNVCPKINPLVEKLLNKPEIKKQFTQYLFDATTKLFNENGLYGRVNYFKEFLKHHMYWDQSVLPKIPTQHLRGADPDEYLDMNRIDMGYNGQGYTCNGDSNGLLDFIKVRSQTVLQSLGATAENINVDNLSKEDLVGLPIEAVSNDGKGDEENLSASDAASTFSILTLPLTLLLSFLIIYHYHS